MAVLSKIRQLPIILLILIIGLPLLTFVMDPSALTDFFNSSKINSVGNVNGESISRQEFAKALDSYRSQTGGRVSEMRAAKSVWNNIVREKLYKTQLDEAGITIGEEDIMNKLYDTQFIQNDARFQTAGIFDKNKLKSFLAKIKDANTQEWKNWQNYIGTVKTSIEKSTYDNLIKAGLGASLKEGEVKYLTENTKVNADIVYVPFTSVADSTVTVSKNEITNYIQNHQDEYQVEATRDISFVKFDLKASLSDEGAIKNEITSIINDREEYSSAAKTNITVKGLKNTSAYKIFFDENKSDIAYTDKVQFKSNVPQTIAEEIFAGGKGDVFGPYKEDGFFKVSKITDVLKMPDSVKARHILISFAGSQSGDAEVTRNEQQAKSLADSLLIQVKKSSTKFTNIAKDFSSDKSNAGKGGDLGWFTYDKMVPAFRDFCFENTKGSYGVVKTRFGYHIIKIEDQKNKQKAVKLATFGRKIEASEATENKIFQNAESYALEISKGISLEEAAKAKNLKVLNSEGLKALDENISNLGKERQVINWAFQKDVQVGDYKRFDIEGGYVVVKLIGKQNKGLMSVEKATNKVRPILLNEKKSEILKGKMKGSSLKEIASSVKQNVRTVDGVNLKSPTISGVGYEPTIVGAMLNSSENSFVNGVVGSRGVFAYKVLSKVLPTTLPNYNTERNRIAKQTKGKTYKVFDALKKAKGVEDNVSTYYGIEE